MKQEDTLQRSRELRRDYYAIQNQQATENRRAVNAFLVTEPEIKEFWTFEQLDFCYDALKLLDSVRWKEKSLGPESRKRVKRAKEIVTQYPFKNAESMRGTFLGREPFILVLIRHLRTIVRRRIMRKIH